jgi:hypothetical protein
MPYPRFFFLLLAVGLPMVLAAQQSTTNVNSPAVDNDFVQREFGKSCKLTEGVPAVAADLNGDGVEDIVIPARCTDPMMDQGDFDYKVIDPYFTFAGYGDPKVTTQYSTEQPENLSLVLLIIHGVGKDAWHAATVKEKFLIVNLPYKQISLKKLKEKKKTVMAIYALEAGGDQMTSAIFWDGKKYRYQPMGSSMQ